MTSTALHRACLSVALLCSGSSLATPTPVQLVLEGSAEGQELFLSVQTSSSTAPQPTPMQADAPPTPVLGQVSGFVQENLLLVLVASGLLLVVALLASAAVAMSRRRRKATAYHPAGFPSQMYVDRRDKTGEDAMPFSEVPAKPPRRLSAQDDVPADSRTQLQSDIARATRSLRSPGKPPGEGGGRGRDPAKSADCVPQDGLPERDAHDALRTRSESEAVTLAGGAERLSEEAIAAQQGVDPDSEEPPSGPGPSQQQHSGSNTVQSVSGQITAF